MLHQKSMRTGLLVIWFCAFGAWVIQLAGLGRVQNMCNENGMNPQEPAFFNSQAAGARAYVRDGHLQSFGQSWNDVPGGDGPENGGFDRCGILFSYDWWIVMYQFFLTVFSFLCIVDEDAHKFKHTLMGFYAIAIFQQTLFTSIYVKYKYQFNGGNHTQDNIGQGCAVCITGGVMLAVFNYVFMFMFGSDESRFAPQSEEGLEASEERKIEEAEVKVSK